MFKPEDKTEEMYICSVCSKLLEPAWEQWICNFCMNYDSHAYKYAHKLNQENESNYD
jgi:hypothetical protein